MIGRVPQAEVRARLNKNFLPVLVAAWALGAYGVWRLFKSDSWWSVAAVGRPRGEETRLGDGTRRVEARKRALGTRRVDVLVSTGRTQVAAIAALLKWG